MLRYAHLILSLFFLITNIFSQPQISIERVKKPRLSLVYIYQGIQITPDDFTDKVSANEINDLLELNLFEKKLNCGSGSGFFISENGYLITNYHVIETNLYGFAKSMTFDIDKKTYDIPSYKISYDEKQNFLKELEKIILRKSIRYWVRTSNGNEYLAETICLSSQDDLALLKINIEKSSFIKISDYKELSIGQDVVALGFPYQSNFEKNQTDFKPTITSGTITNLTNELWSIQHTAVINPGNSGGPLIDNNGNLIGINVGYNSLKKIYFSINTERLINWLKSINYDYLVSSVKKTDMEKLLSAGKHILIDLEEGYDIYLDGKKIGSTPKLIELNNENSFIRIENENQYADYKIKFENSINDVFVFEPVFENYYGKLSINVENDPDSIIFLDDCELGKTPIAIEKIKTGSHTITVKSKDKQLFSDEITIEKDLFLEKKYNLKKGQKLLFADSLPIDSLIEISNGKIRVAYLKNEDIFLPKGEWEISIKSKFLNNNGNNKKQITMGDTDLVVENIIESEKSILSLIGYETNRKVFIDDQEVTERITNGKVLVLPGYHTLLVTQTDRMPFLKEIEIEKNKELKLFLNMLYTSYPILIDKDKK